VVSRATLALGLALAWLLDEYRLVPGTVEVK
jgi:hypothetical protein